MKKFVSFLLCLVFVLSLFSCNTAYPDGVSRDEAITIAKKHWESFEIEKNKCLVMLGDDSNAPENVYVVLIKQRVSDSHYSTIDKIWIDKSTGKTIVPQQTEDTPSDGNGQAFPISAKDAQTIAGEHWGIQNGEMDAGCGTRFACRLLVADCLYDGEKTYYHVIRQVDNYHGEYFSTEDWYNSGKYVSPYGSYKRDELLVDAVSGECKPYTTRNH